ncbi:MAG: phospholipid carrier-dependent glycosyltransferase [Alphaproteobacteria bacterium]|nr:phospholipid carrier-dependent glycosyltransferase [Alphaproteobacteria bacterium]
MDRAIDYWRRQPAFCVGLAIAALVLVRIIAVIVTPLEIGPDEAQYWRWSRTLDWGYYSKPPLIAWAIALTTGLFGNGEWAIRLSAPIAHGLAGFFLFLLGRSAFDARVGAWSAALYLFMPGVWLSSTIMSTDALLLPLWSAAMLCLWRLRDQPALAHGALLGLALGLAMLAKYAALYLFIGAALAAIVDTPTRRALLSWSGLAALAVFIAVLAPNLVWNAANKFETLSHTTDNANWNNASFDFGHLGQFILDQMGVFGPLTFLVLAAGVAMLMRPSSGETFRRELWFASFIAPPLLVIMVQAVISRAHANWAATAYPAAAVLAASWIARPRWSVALKAGVALNVFLGLVFLVAWTVPSIGDAGGAANAYKRVRGWREATMALQKLAAQDGATALMFDDREVWHGVDYYGRNLDIPPVRAWRRGDEPHSYAEGAGTMRPGEDRKILIASVVPPFRDMIKADFDTIEPAGDLVIPLGPKRKRVLKLFLASGYHPKPRTPEFEAQFQGEDD